LLLKPPWDLEVGDKFIIHYTYGCDYDLKVKTPPSYLFIMHVLKRNECNLYMDIIILCMGCLILVTIPRVRQLTERLENGGSIKDHMIASHPPGILHYHPPVSHRVWYGFNLIQNLINDYSASYSTLYSSL